MKFLQSKLTSLLLIFTFLTAFTAWAQTPYTLNHGFGGASGLPQGIQIVSYSGETGCITTSNGATAVTTLVLRAATGYNFTIETINGTGVRSNSGPTQFNFQIVNNGNTVNGTVSTVSGSSSCNGGTAITQLAVPQASQLVTSGNTVTINIPRAPGSTSGLGYSHVKTLVINGNVTVQAPVATPATTITTGGFTANWNAVTGATGYRLDVSTDLNFDNILEDYDNMAVEGLSQYVFMGILPNTTYYYRVRAEVTEQISGNSNVITVVVPACSIVPVPQAAAQLFCGTGTVSQLMATGQENAVMNWYEAQTGGTALPGNTTLITGTYYVSQTVGGCVSERIAVEVTVNEVPPAPETIREHLFCGAATVSNLTALTGQNLKWYMAVGGEPLSPDTPVIMGNYFVTQTVNGCESAVASTEASILEIPAAPVAPAQQFCGSGTVADLMVTTGLEPKWYTAETEGEALATDAPLTSGTYYVSQTVSVCESPRTPVIITVYDVPVAPVAAAQLFCGPATVASLTVTTGNSPLWYTASTGGTALPADVPLGTSTYYVSQTVNGCESARTAVAVSIGSTPVAPTAAPVVICGEGTVADLTATTGTNLIWYTTETEGEALAPETAVVAGTYYVSQTVNGCESLRTAVQVTINQLPQLPVVTIPSFCGSGTVGQLTVGEGTYLWYASATGGEALSNATALTTGTYYVSQIADGCESLRLAVVITVNALPLAPLNPVGVQTFCNDATISDLDANGENIRWYAAATGGEALSEETQLSQGISLYYASQTINGCESPRTAVAIQLNVTTLPVATAQAFCGTAAVNDLTVTIGTAPKWYATATGGDALAADVVLEAGTYYVSQTVNGCESGRTPVEVTLNVTPMPQGQQIQEFTEGDTLENLIVTGENIIWYEDETLSRMLDSNTLLTDGTIYYAVANNGDCSSEPLAVTAEEVLSTTGFDKGIFTAFPNPVTSTVTITGTQTISGIIVYNLLGQPVLNKQSNAFTATIDMATLTAGTYFIRVEFNNNFSIIKVIKK